MVTNSGILKTFTAFVIFSLFVAPLTYSSPVIHEFTGTAFVARGFWSGMGTDVTGSYTYDSDLVDSLANSNTIDKFQSNTAINASFDWEITFALGTESRTVTSADRAFTFILNDKAADQYSFSAGGLANITLNDNNSDAIQNLSNSAPTSAPDLSLFGSIKRKFKKILTFLRLNSKI